MSDFPGGKFHIRRRVDGAVRLEFGTAVVVVSPENAVRLAQALLKEAGVEMVVAEPGQTVIRTPRKLGDVLKFGGY
jgi:hypothetical protein